MHSSTVLFLIAGATAATTAAVVLLSSPAGCTLVALASATALARRPRG